MNPTGGLNALPRRRLAGLSLAALACGAGQGQARAEAPAPDQAQDPAMIQAGPSLGQRAAAKGLRYGGAVRAATLQSDPGYAALVAREFTIIVPEIEAKWAETEPEEGVFRFAGLDWLCAYAEAHGMKVRLHNLLWGVYNPPWVEAALRQGRAEAVLDRHIRTVCGRYAGRVAAWDVVNECSDPRWNHADDLVNTPWHRALGAGFLDSGFHQARLADPGALLFLNDDLLEYADAGSEAKRAGYLRLVERLLRRGLPVQGFGLEAHLRSDRVFAPGPYRRFLAELAAMGLVLHVTELDVSDRQFPPAPAARDAAIAALCKAFLDTALDEPAVRAVLTWGITTRASWLTSDQEVARTDGLLPRGLPYDGELRRMGMWNAMARAFDHAPPRPAG